MSRPSDAFNSEMDYLWRAVGDAQDASARSEKERAEARHALEQAASKAGHLERQLAESRTRERQLKAETEHLKEAARKDEDTLSRAAGKARAASELQTQLRRKENESTLLDAELQGLRAETASLREALAAREAAIETFKQQIAGITSLPEIARTLKEDSRASGKQRSVYEYLLGSLETGRREAKQAADELAATAERENQARAALAVSENELSGLRAELVIKRQGLASLEAALAESSAKENLSAEERAALRARAAALGAALEEKERSLGAALKDCAALRSALDASKLEAQRLRQAADEHAQSAQEQRNNFTGAVAQVFDLQKRASEFKSALADAQERAGALAVELKQRDADIEKVNGLLREAKLAGGQEKEISRRAALKIKALENDLEGLKTRLAASDDYSARLLKALEARDQQIAALHNDLKRIPEVELENEDLRRKNIKFSGLLLREQADFTAKMLASLEKTARDLKAFNLRIPAAERKALEPGLKNLLGSVNLLKGWQEYLDPETPELEETDLAGFVRGETEKWERAFKQRKISVTSAILNPRLRARVSVERLKMLFYQLVKNSYERLQQGGSLRVTLKGSEDGREAVLAFEDTGPGFAREALDKLFAPFNTTDKGKAGIGLAVARRIAEKHGGTLTVANKAERGAVVEVRLPLGNAAP
ncbi:MAG: hypothetical protein A2X32_05165 [Elusimicrobia bacterium GWC2_64_44]|nr:MAG: hypothetical protein A2X32_05165 [Elusimicrobia bacterium GWC2_64_44]